MNEQQQIAFSLSQAIANLRNTLFNACVISTQSQQQLILINMQSLIERMTNETIKQQLIDFVNAFGGLLQDCSQSAHTQRQTLLTRISQIVLTYYNTMTPVVFTRIVYVRPRFTHPHPHPHPHPPPPTP